MSEFKVLSDLLGKLKDKPKYDPSQEPIIKNLIKKRLRSVYQVSYCKFDDQDIYVDPNSDQLMIRATRLYREKTEPVPKPTITYKKTMGYTRPSWFYTGMSVYQDEIGRLGYEILRKDYDEGVSRLYDVPLRKKRAEEACKERARLKEAQKKSLECQTEECCWKKMREKKEELCRKLAEKRKRMEKQAVKEWDFPCPGEAEEEKKAPIPEAYAVTFK